MSWDPVWEKVFSSQQWGKYPGEDLIRFVARNFYKAEDRSVIRILEIGCGPGANLWYMAREGFKVYGIDGSSSAVTQAQQYLNASVPGWEGEVIKGDIINQPYQDGWFDAIIDNEAGSCNSYENALLIYKEAHRVLKPGGKIFIRTFAEGSWGEGTGERLAPDAWSCSQGPLAGKGYSRFTKQSQIPELLAGFEIESIEKLDRTMDDMKQVVSEWLVNGVKK
ncbi:class I SAM-dependent methyltransferase [Cohnella hashimotonis]|uniref:Class I SAM-dependent methyltransferase n=1 Tax=Cohnella hashimotonis TaxID=2826895 RepID=A0ABT6TU44_9BACL|nr:class I SAM-dependent methyltransferase [Cohnella hashimotonis]MDI4650370.1 class I SAM-dependent methyltransferase [Cohnella hashimotonis]